MKHALLALAVLASPTPLALAQAGTGHFRAGDVYLYSPALTGISSGSGGIVRVDPHTGDTETILPLAVALSTPGCLCYDPWRDRLIAWGGFAPNQAELFTLDAEVNVTSLGFPTSAGPVIAHMSARGDGLVYMTSYTNPGRISYLDANDQIQTLLDAGGLPYTFSQGSGGVLVQQYHAPTNSLVVASYSNLSACPSEVFDAVTVFRLDLSADGTRVLSESCFPYDVTSASGALEIPVGLAPGPDGDLLLTVDTNLNGGMQRLARIDVACLTATPFATTDYLGDAATSSGCYSQVLAKAIVLDTSNDVLRAFAEGQGGGGSVVASDGVSYGNAAGEVTTLVEIAGPATHFGLASDRSALSLAAGGSQALFVDLPTQAGRVYWVLGSVSGWTPGLTDGGPVLPLNVDSYFLYTLLTPNAPPLSGALGVLDANGEASAAFTLPAGLDPGLAGAVFHHAALTFDASLLAAAATNAVPLELLP